MAGRLGFANTLSIWARNRTKVRSNQQSQHMTLLLQVLKPFGGRGRQLARLQNVTNRSGTRPCRRGARQLSSIGLAKLAPPQHGYSPLQLL
jgi:hypothetical protein